MYCDAYPCLCCLRQQILCLVVRCSYIAKHLLYLFYRVSFTFQFVDAFLIELKKIEMIIFIIIEAQGRTLEVGNSNNWDYESV